MDAFLDVTVAANKTPHIFTGNLDITASSTAAMTINTGASVEITVVSDSSFTGASTGYNGTVTNNRRIGYAGINVKTGATLTISSYSTGTLTAQGVRGEVVGVNHFLGVIFKLVNSYFYLLIATIVVIYIGLLLLEEIRREKEEKK